MFDWRQLQRWHIPQPLLPRGSRIHFKPQSAWDQYRWYIVGVVVIALLQASVIILLALERARRRQSEKRYHIASHAGGVSVWDWNLATNEFYVGPHLKTLLGYADHHVGNHIDDWVRLIHADDAAVLRARVKDVLEGKSSSFETEYRMLHREGALHWFLVRGSAVHKHNRLVRIAGTATDITERKQAEQALDDIQAELTRVSRLTALGEFSASIAHELRQPLTVIMINVQTCLRWLRDQTPDLGEIRTALQETVQASRRAADLIQRNRDLFKMRTVRKEQLDINNLIRDAAVLARPRLQANRVTLITSLHPKIAPIRGDRIELQQVLLNLIANGIDATQQTQPGRRRIEIRTMMTLGMNVKVCVIDNGVGLDGVDMKKLFTLSYTTKATGSGIGLSLCRSIVEAHGGKLWAEPNPGPGASFFFTIPARVPADPAPSLIHA